MKEKNEAPAIPFSTPLTPAQLELEREYHSATGALSQIQRDLIEAAKGFDPLNARRLQIPGEKDTWTQLRFEASARGESTKPAVDKLTALDNELKALDSKQVEVEEAIRELNQIRNYAQQRKGKALRELCAARLTGLSDEINELLLALHPRLKDVEAIHRHLGMSVSPIVPPGNFQTLPSARYPETLTLERK